MQAIIGTLSSRIQPAQLAALRWIAMLMVKCPDKLSEFYEKVPARCCAFEEPIGTLTFCVCLPRRFALHCCRTWVKSRIPTLSMPTSVICLPFRVLSSAVVLSVARRMYPQLEVLAQIARHDPAYQRNKILPGIMSLFASRRPLLEARGSYVIRKLCQLLDPQAIYIALAEILLSMEDLEFITLTIEILNILLLTAQELVGLRDLLRGCLSDHHGSSSLAAARYRKQRSPSFHMRTSSSGAAAASPTASSVPSAGVDEVVVTDGEAGASKSGTEVFVTLYTTWSHSPIATFSLCLLAQAYELACSLVSKLYVPLPSFSPRSLQPLSRCQCLLLGW